MTDCLSALICRQNNSCKVQKSSYNSDIELHDHKEEFNSCNNAQQHNETDFSLLTSHFSHKRAAFTLAEVLITLGVIGVVAAITIPNMISKHEKHVIETGLQKTYSDLQNMIKLSEVENGSYEYWDYSNSYQNGQGYKFVNQYIAPYMPLKACSQSTPCFAGYSKNASNTWRIPDGNYDTEGRLYSSPKYLMSDGRSICIQVMHAPHEHDIGGYWDYVEFVVDVNGKRGKSIMGKDVFTFSLNNYYYNGKKIKGFHVGMSENSGDFSYSTATLYNYCKQKSGSGSRKCGLIIQRNGWKFPDDYPIKF